MSDCTESSCPVHNRVDEFFIDEDAQIGSIITYVGSWVVFSGENTAPDVSAIRLLLKMTENPDMSDSELDKLFENLEDYDRFETVVYEVGETGVLGDLYEGMNDADAMRATQAANKFSTTHNKWDNFKQAHQMVVDSVRDGLISL